MGIPRDKEDRAEKKDCRGTDYFRLGVNVWDEMTWNAIVWSSLGPSE
jgi:hypothetical protein